MIKVKSLPSSEGSERGLIGSILLAPDRVMEICQDKGISSDWFYHPSHAVIFDSVIEMRKLDISVNLISLTQFLEDRDRLEKVGGAAYVTELFIYVPTASNADYFVQVLHEKHVLRSGILAAEKARSELYKCLSLQDAHQIVTSAFQDTLALFNEKEKEDTNAKMMLEFVDEMDAICRGEKKADTFPTYFPTLDEEAGGMRRGELYVVHGLTSCGKSVTAQHFLQHNVFQNGKRGAWFSFEMGYSQCVRRLIASEARISLKSMRQGIYTKPEMDRFTPTALKIGQSPLTIYDIKRCKPCPSALVAAVRRHHRKQGLDMVLVDYLQLLRMNGGKGSRRDQDLQSFSADLKCLAGELDLVIILVAQANKDGSVFDASQVESDADGVLTMLPVWKEISGVKKVIGVDSIFVQKFREAQRGMKIPVQLLGEFATIQERVD